MFDADLAIGAGGSSSWERCCLGLADIIVCFGRKSKKNSRKLRTAWNAVKIVDNLKVNLQNILNNLHFWQTMSENAQTVCDGIGVKRIKI